MVVLRPTRLCHDFVRSAVQAGDTVIDATAGNGHDTVLLADLVGETGRVIAFDVQAEALAATREKLNDCGWLARVSLVCGSHAGMAGFAPANSVAAVMFNLGYLPRADHRLTTTAEETCRALAAAATLLKAGGLLAVVCYPGHDEGAHEAVAVEEFFTRQTSAGWTVAKYAMLGTMRPAPFLLIAVKGDKNGEEFHWHRKTSGAPSLRETL